MPRLVLIVDDNPQAASTLEIALDGLEGCEICVASSGREALRLIAARVAGTIAAIVTDLQMPGIDGFDLIEMLRKDPEFRRVPIIVSSATTDPDVPDRVRRLGADAFYPKPCSPTRIRQHLEKLLNEDRP